MKRFAHISDTHIRNLKYHYEYRKVFEQLYSSLRESSVDYIIHCGDIAHTKTQISPEFVDMTCEFFASLADIAPTYIILGNHDGNLRNSSRQDALTPIIKALDHKNLYLLKDSCSLKLDKMFNLHVLSVFDEENWPTLGSFNEDKINIALYHGSILSCETDIGWVMDSTDHKINIFHGFDYAFLGDIHKTQILDEEGKIRYAGSTIQQNFGEDLEKGYLLWSITDKDTYECEHITFQNPKPFITIPLSAKGNLPRKLKIPTGARLRIVSENNVSLDKMRKAISIVKYKYEPESVTYLNRAASKKISIGSAAEHEQKDLRDVRVQELLITEYLKEFEVSEEVLKKVMELNLKYNSEIEEKEEVFRNINWSLKALEWDNLFNYGSSNRIDFAKLDGIVGIFGKNFTGKSSIVDSLLYALYNSTSKSVRKNLNMINQNKENCRAKAIIQLDDKEYHIERISEKYVKRLHGERTLEAKTDLEFCEIDIAENIVGLNGTSRQDTDKNIRKYFGTLEDFLITSMSSQLDSLTFINEGSTRRKELLAKFLDLEIFDKKFKMAKEHSAEVKAALKKLTGIDFDKEISGVKKEIVESDIFIERNKQICDELQEEILFLRQEQNEIQQKINLVPADIIDIADIKSKIFTVLSKINLLDDSSVRLEQRDKENKTLYEKIERFLNSFNVEEYFSKQEIIEEKTKLLESFINKLKSENEAFSVNKKKRDLLGEVPCGSEFSHCKFIKDAYAAIDLIQINETNVREFSIKTNTIADEIKSLNPKKVENHINKYNQVLNKKNQTATSMADVQLLLEKNNAERTMQKMMLGGYRQKEREYRKNKKVIENLENLFDKRNVLREKISTKELEHKICYEETLKIYRSRGSLDERLQTMENQKIEAAELEKEYAAYDLLMLCTHPNGISYDIIKERLPIINDEIAKILANIVEFEIFIQNDDKKLDIFIKHPKHDPRPLEMGSGAEKTIAQMAIRLAFLTVSSLPKSDLFILDEPGTSLDEENMEGFVRILDMVKSYFKTVLLISHLDVLKDCVDMEIIIDRKDGYAHIDI